MKQVPLSALENVIAKPGFERELIPLLAYRGQLNLGRAHRLWNFTVAMMLHEAESLSEGVNRLQMNPEWSQLCLPENRVQFCSISGFMNRLRDNRPVTDLVPGLTDYVATIYPRFYAYRRVPIEASRSRAAWWRTFTPKARGPSALTPPPDFFEIASGRSIEWAKRHFSRSEPVIRRWFALTGAEYERLETRPVLVYPFLIHDGGKPEHDLLRLIDAAIPRHLPPDLRADMCQDLAVGCLTGDFNKDDLYLPAKEVAKRVHRMFPTKYGPISLDAPLSDDGSFSILDTLIDEGRDWS
jgi:hypothetical protein